MEEKITPEEKLLKIIENPTVEKRKAPVLPQASAAGIKQILGRIKNFRFNKDVLKSFDLRMANKLIAVFCGILTVYWVSNFVMSGISYNQRFKKAMDVSQSADKKDASLPNIEVSTENFIQEARKRNIFTLVPTSAEASGGVPESAAASSVLKLVGIMWSDNPQAMIEDTKDQKTYLVGAGDQVAQIEIRKILRDKVILGKEDKEWELR